MPLPAAIEKLTRQMPVMEQAPMSRHTTFRVGGPARFMVMPESHDQVALALAAAGEAGLPVTLLGGGSNFLVSDRGIDGLVLGLKKIKSGPCSIQIQTSPAGRIGAGAGNSLASVCRFAAKAGLTGLEFLAGIPGTLGGALAMNAGSAKTWIGERVHTLTVMDLASGRIETLDRDQLDFGYRRLNLPGKVILAAELDLDVADVDQVMAAHRLALDTKQKAQPVTQASAGCFFKNPAPDTPAGQLIDRAGLKGETLNGAMVSPMHANFIVNTGNARCRDILALAERVKTTVKTRFNIQLENEVKVIGHA